MRRLTTTLIITAGLAFASPALAKSSQKFKSDVAAPISTVKVEVVIGEDLAWRADNLPENIRDRGHTRGLNDGFGGNGFYGERDLNILAERMERQMAKRLEKEGVAISDNASQTLRITLTDARPTRPTMKQMSKSSGLSMQSFALGGAAFEGEILSPSGETQGQLSYAWYENDIHQAQYGTTWSDAKRAIDRFAKKAAKSIN
ncbi:MAG: DUF3313 family protein [Hellea sp.]|nr:DUF3313 family protein [Hellea sp.]